MLEDDFSSRPFVSLSTHNALHKLGKQGGGAGSSDTVAKYAADIARHTQVLCLDEFQAGWSYAVSDVGAYHVFIMN